MRSKSRQFRSILVATIVLSIVAQFAIPVRARTGGDISGADRSSVVTPQADAVTPVTLDLDVVASGFMQPTDLVEPHDGTGRLFVVERLGLVRVIKSGQVLDEPFLDLTGMVSNGTWEQGLLGIAFHPDFAHNGIFFVTSSPAPDEWRLERYVVSSDPNRADPASAQTVLSFDHPGGNHYGGKIVFGDDGYLWISVGDGGGGYDQYGNAQNLDSLLGKILRIDVDRGDPYAIPADNPFVGTSGARPEIWAYGLRNPWRFSFDRLTGDLYIGDVGETTWEEVNFEPAGSPGGRNYGWPQMEGMSCSQVAPDCDPSLYVLPISQHGRDDGCAVTGGYVYRGDETSPLWGTYVFADYCNGTIWTAERSGDGWVSGIQLRTPLNISAFGESDDGSIYVVDFTRGGIYQLMSTEDAPAPKIIRTGPGSLLAGGVSCGLNVRGWNFAEGARVRIADEARETRYIDSTWLQVRLTSDEIAQPALLSVVVDNGVGTQSAQSTLPINDRGGSNGAIYERWAHDDLPVLDGSASRTWLWGSSGFSCPMAEEYAEGPNGQRMVQYFDKSRMEITQPEGDPSSTWYITNGLLATELMTGNIQLGDTLFEQREPAEINVAGDPDDPSGPTYRTFNSVSDHAPLTVGTTLTQRINRDGRVWVDGTFAARRVTAAYLDTVTNHTIASPFWDYMHLSGLVFIDGKYLTSPIFENPYYATGRPLTEAYWTSVEVGNVKHDVLAQC
ncbi:MAG TPA: PQQ-dependent sugar dehydrogenase, partial [Thermomicrobiales bacterium]|nr:PQQ-dependent sugar dehydrogenase [Thermomicrobiales bacterium]